MKTKRLLLALSFLLLLAERGDAQLENLSIINIPPPGVDFIQTQRSHMTWIPMKNNWKTDIRGYWNGQGADLMAFTIMRNPDLRVAWNLSDEQYQALIDIEANIDNVRQNDSEYQQLMEEIQTMQAMIDPDDPFPLNTDIEIINRWLDIEERGGAWMTNYYSDSIRSILTPEQMRKIQETHLAIMDDFPIVSPFIFEALDLTDDQKQWMEEIRKELEPEFEMVLDDFVNGQLLLVNKGYDELEKLGVNDIDSMMREMSTAMGILAEDPEFKRVRDEVESKGRQFATQFRTRLFDVLTDEQWYRLQELINNPPEHARAFRTGFGENKDEIKESDDVWIPGPGSWRPGDPIPEAYRQQRNLDRRFPRPQ